MTAVFSIRRAEVSLVITRKGLIYCCAGELCASVPMVRKQRAPEKCPASPPQEIPNPTSQQNRKPRHSIRKYLDIGTATVRTQTQAQHQEVPRHRHNIRKYLDIGTTSGSTQTKAPHQEVPTNRHNIRKYLNIGTTTGSLKTQSNQEVSTQIRTTGSI